MSLQHCEMHSHTCSVASDWQAIWIPKTNKGRVKWGRRRSKSKLAHTESGTDNQNIFSQHSPSPSPTLSWQMATGFLMNYTQTVAPKSYLISSLKIHSHKHNEGNNRLQHVEGGHVVIGGGWYRGCVVQAALLPGGAVGCQRAERRLWPEGPSPSPPQAWPPPSPPSPAGQRAAPTGASLPLAARKRENETKNETKKERKKERKKEK